MSSETDLAAAKATGQVWTKRDRALTPPPRPHHRPLRDIDMAKYKFTATSRTGKKVNPITGAPTDTVTVYSRRGLNKRIRAAKSDPRALDITVEEIP